MEKTTIYQIFPLMFKDTTGNGLGDLQGIIEKLDYISDLGFETIWINPFFSSPFLDAGYDITDYRNVATQLGSLEICQKLIQEVHNRNMKIIFDLVLNHTSDQHPWFKESRSSRDNPKRNWYVWKDGQKPNGKKPLNNWRSFLHGKTGWNYDKSTDQWYFAHFFAFQPDLNYWNPEVRQAMLDIVRYWFDQGVDGYRLDFVNALFHDKFFRNNPFKKKLIPSALAPDMLFQDSYYSMNRPETIKFMKEIRAIADDYNPSRFLVGEATTSPKILKQFCGQKKFDGLHKMFLFACQEVPLEVIPIKNMVKENEYFFPDPYYPMWFFSSHDRIRRIARLNYNFEKAKANTVLHLTGRGVPFVYNGEEIGIPQPDLPVRTSRDPIARRWGWIPPFILKFAKKYIGETINREECRTPMQWDRTKHARFCAPNQRPFLPFPPGHQILNIEVQSKRKDSLYNVFKNLLHIRNQYIVLQIGQMSFIEWNESPKTLLAYSRYLDDGIPDPQIDVYINLGEKPIHFVPFDDYNTVLYSSKLNSNPWREGQIFLLPWEGILIKE